MTESKTRCANSSRFLKGCAKYPDQDDQKKIVRLKNIQREPKI